LNPPVIFDILLWFSLGACALEGNKDGKPFKEMLTMKTAQTGDTVYRGRDLRGCDGSNGGGEQP
jgi:hypothetical protein